MPGCGVTEADVGALYVKLERARREWITTRVSLGQDVPLPNSHLYRASAADFVLRLVQPAEAELT